MSVLLIAGFMLVCTVGVVIRTAKAYVEIEREVRQEGSCGVTSRKKDKLAYQIARTQEVVTHKREGDYLATLPDPLSLEPGGLTAQGIPLVLELIEDDEQYYSETDNQQDDRGL
ncbi:MAG: hypothetical protein VX836_13755 [Pseudomonadota bacterium]|nr:hypothetical protein [Pseudomonadota bacterium]